ncbi:DUF3182 domain-containing protein [Microvirga sp. KLBC 81]|uniref:DUF3182 family protein n=1 Tax=Microvirga sp. KLBC 81 TaxID=1862707 RepID=UPI000D51A725|nr:DUF3182 family protein [Microvirga sp. KLBC 81]PVE21277.1 DUF3182 domain-containing protein [Microvirga sp. KLBC 81]
MAHDVVVEYSPLGGGFCDAHERSTRATVAKRLAALMGVDYAGTYDRTVVYPGRVYFVPSTTLVGLEQAAQLGITGERDLFGGVVPHPFVCTKAITHPLIRPNASAPEGWSDTFPRQVQSAVLEGYSVFSSEQAQIAGQRLLEDGPVRLKPVNATAGRGQRVVQNRTELTEALATIDPAELTGAGLVLEENLTAVTTYSVGQVRVADLTATYYGSQRLTTDGSGKDVYGGSDLVVVRGDFDTLVQLPLPKGVHTAVEQARAYDAATSVFPGMFASRRNYDVAQGINARGQWRSGVLEQSWRIGGATGAEIAALESFRDNPGLQVVHAATFEIYGESQAPPPHATVYFRGVDEKVGFLTKYALVRAHGDTR